MTMSTYMVPFLDLSIHNEEQRSELIAAVDRVFMHGRLVMGPEVDEIERIVARDCRRRYAVGVGSGTDALWMAMRVLGLRPGDEVVTTSLSWIATANAIAMAGAIPVFADIRCDLNIDPESVRRLITDRTRAILVVHYTGRMCDMQALSEIAEEHNLALVEDAAQAYGASLNGRPAGSFGNLACFSMNPMKVFAACGEAGMIVTDDTEQYERLLALRYNGCVNREVCIEPSTNGRIDTLQAAILLTRHRHLAALLKRRRSNAARYDKLLQGVVDTPPIAPGEHAYYTYTIQADRRDELQDFLEKHGVETKIQHPILMPEQPAYSNRAVNESVNACCLQKRILCLPIHENLAVDEIKYVAARVCEFYP
ncbi:MAG: DegT/DnrJ/EryC1/StrS family aminotransferase [Sedimenticola sp.]